jgi:hypothetical protein
MTVRVAFLAAALVVASHVSVAQSKSAGQQTSANSAANAAQLTATYTNNAGASGPAASAAARPTANDSADRAATNAGDARVENSALEQETAANNGQLPQTSTILPLLGLIGLGSLVAGFFARR